jgi:PEP-CTERM motif
MKKILGLMIVGLLVFAPAAGAYTFTVSNFLGTGTFGTVTVTNITGGVEIVVLPTSPELLIGPGSGAFGFNTSFDLTGVNPSHVTSGFGPLWDTTGGGTMDGFGKFDYVIDGPTGGSGLPSLTFDLIASGLNVSTFAFTTNDKGRDFAAHVSVTNSGGTCTGFISDGTGGSTTGGDCAPEVPEPATMLLLGSGLLGAGFFRRRQKKS